MSAENSPPGVLVVLLYHGVSDREHRGISNSSGKHVSAAEFSRQMEILARRKVALGLSEGLSRLREGTLPCPSVAVTFDDGFENNHSVAFPILRRYEIPAEFFLTTGFIGTSQVFWVDKMEYLIGNSPRREITLSCLKQRFGLADPDQRRQSLTAIKQVLKSTPGLVTEAVKELEAAADVPPSYDDPDYRLLSWEQVREMEASGLCGFSPHSIDHSILSHLSGAQKRRQILESKETLERQLEHPVSFFAYPEGLGSHYDAETVRILHEAGFKAGWTAIFGVNTPETDRFHLHRNMVGMTAPFEECLEPESWVKK